MEEERLVEAIEEGRIVKVPESYAKSEGLPIIRRDKREENLEHYSRLSPGTPQHIKSEFKRPFSEILEHPKSWKSSQVTSELLENFNWQIRIERKRQGLTRKQLAKLLNEPEENLKMLEAGFLPSNDFILINKIQKTLGVNLRKDQRDYSKSFGEMIKNTEQVKQPEVWKSKVTKSKTDEDDGFSGTDIEVLDKDI